MRGLAAAAQRNNLGRFSDRPEDAAEVAAADLCNLFRGESLPQKLLYDGGVETAAHSLPSPVQAGAGL